MREMYGSSPSILQECMSRMFLGFAGLIFKMSACSIQYTLTLDNSGGFGPGKGSISAIEFNLVE